MGYYIYLQIMTQKMKLWMQNTPYAHKSQTE